jgi:hypothetical protein
MYAQILPPAFPLLKKRQYNSGFISYTYNSCKPLNMSPVLKIKYLRSCKRLEDLNVYRYHFQFITVVELKVEKSTKKAVILYILYKRYTVIAVASL